MTQKSAKQKKSVENPLRNLNLKCWTYYAPKYVAGDRDYSKFKVQWRMLNALKHSSHVLYVKFKSKEYSFS